jgi:hypothetical protein
MVNHGDCLQVMLAAGGCERLMAGCCRLVDRMALVGWCRRLVGCRWLASASWLLLKLAGWLAVLAGVGWLVFLG